MAPWTAWLAVVPLAAVCAADLRHRIIPDWCVAALALIGLLGAAGAQQSSGPDALQSALLAGGFCALIGGGLSVIGLWGWGDAKLLAAAGLITGVAGMPRLFMAMALAGGGLALLLLVLRGCVRRGRLALKPDAPRWLRAERRRLRLAPSVPYGLAIVAGLIAGM
ncbi:A24 family peptidase [Sandarakinorhabdus sp. AAP62]|uniref:prepilin peptidase n=1 Tax=Sandarakinorhabdus sp. AAP62 TaxID=1248916 RepID=UPI0002FDDA1C|nr:A24 family peptidase [Sandarakinorhabdus sp. AAP62]